MGDALSLSVKVFQSKMKFKATIIRKSRGFALIVTLSLLILLTVVAVGLLTLSSIALRSSSQGDAMATAHANARLAMMLAVGDLQKYVGPDQRVTARADLVAGAANPLYTGVWDTRVATLDKTMPLAWLVSGNNASGLTNTPLVSAANGGVAVTALVQEVKSTTASQPNGAFAYWVSDEGVKARINLDSPGYRKGATATDAARAFAGSPRAAIELMETAVTPPTGAVSSAWGSNIYPYVAETTPKLITTGQLPLYAAAGQQNAAQAATKARFHDLTAHSSSVLADTAKGGLRQDLTTILSDPTQGPADSEPIFPAAASTSTQIQCLPPTWGRLRAWWNNPVDPSTGSLTPTLRTATTPPIAPVVMWAELGLAFFSEDLSTATPPGAGYRIRVQAFPRAIIWNPYTVPMSAGTYELGFSTLSAPSGSTGITLENTAGTKIGTYYLTKYGFNSGASSRYLRFTVTVPKLAAGKARAFSFNTTGDPTLKDGDNPGNYTVLNASSSDYLDSTVPPPYRLNIPNTPSFGGSFSLYLRATGEADPGPVNDEVIPSKVHQWAARNGVNQPGVTGASSLISLPTAGATAPQPHLRVVNKGLMNDASAWIRWLANGNQLAPVLIRHTADTTASPFYRGLIFSPSQTTLPSTPDGDVSVGAGLSSLPGNGGLTLREARLPDTGLYQSIAHLQHAPLNDTGCGPLNSVGNSLQNPRIPDRTATSIQAASNPLNSPLYDSSYLLNQALWDKYFLSTIPSTLTAADLASPGYNLPNARFQPLVSADAAKLKKHDTAAANIMQLGGFNINSTSEQAWRAVLGAAQNLKYNPVTGAMAPSDPSLSPFSRFIKPLGDFNDRYRGYRQLNETQIAALAAAMVKEVRERGPFRSLADFVNRRLVAKTDPASPSGLKGAVQAAIDSADWDSSTAKQINNLAPYTANITGVWGDGKVMDWEAWLGVPANVSTSGKSPTSSRNAFGPGYLTQADVLSRIGSAISARSDTFVIRTCGEARNGGTVTAKAYCEAVVQRNPDYVDPSTAPEGMPATGSTNERFGRRFSIISFRWLSPNEI